ncbi:MAG: helix-turn-helix transcriptional regulator [Tsuneonella sp.]
MKQAVIVSHEMTTLVGEGAAPPFAHPAQPVLFAFAGLSDSATPLITYRDHCDLSSLEAAPLVFVVERAACVRLFAHKLIGEHSWHLPSALRALALSIIDCDAPGEARTTLQLARSIELLCQVHAALAEETLVPSCGERALSEHDVARIAAARRAIDQRWHEKLTIADLARVAGINRDKLVRGFRDLYGTTIAEVLSEHRLGEARRMLLASDLPVATVAYRCSYLNNASFTRAFARRFGVAPSALRRAGASA